MHFGYYTSFQSYDVDMVHIIPTTLPTAFNARVTCQRNQRVLPDASNTTDLLLQILRLSALLRLLCSSELRNNLFNY
jgi:hypothetical protein